jgi:hypothetical protein
MLSHLAARRRKGSKDPRGREPAGWLLATTQTSL